MHRIDAGEALLPSAASLLPGSQHVSPGAPRPAAGAPQLPARPGDRGGTKRGAGEQRSLRWHIDRSSRIHMACILSVHVYYQSDGNCSCIVGRCPRTVIKDMSSGKWDGNAIHLGLHSFLEPQTAMTSAPSRARVPSETSMPRRSLMSNNSPPHNRTTDANRSGWCSQKCGFPLVVVGDWISCTRHSQSSTDSRFYSTPQVP